MFVDSHTALSFCYDDLRVRRSFALFNREEFDERDSKIKLGTHRVQSDRRLRIRKFGNFWRGEIGAMMRQTHGDKMRAKRGLLHCLLFL